MAQATSIQRTLSELRKHADGSGDDSLLDLVIEMEAKLAENGAAISVGNISNSTAVAIGNGIDIVVHQSNVPEALVAQLKDLLTALGKPATAPINWTRGKSPFPGLRAFGEEYAPVFFGRTAETEQLLARLTKPDCRFLMVVGASGSGKSSLVRAGLIPRLRQGVLHGSENWRSITFTPDAFGKGDPFDVLAYELHQAWSGLDIQTTASHLRDNRSGLREVLENALSQAEPNAVLVIDQFEEIFSRVIDEDLRRKFLASISEATNSQRILTIATLRDDFFHYCVKSPILSRLINRNNDSTYTLSAPGQLELYEMINGPAQVAELQFENGLVRKILEDTGSQPGALALMAYALDQLHKASGRDGILKFDAYLSFGGVQGAIGSRAQEVFERLSEEARKTLPYVFKELLEVDESGTATRKRTPLEQVERDAASRELVEALVQDRLLMTSRGANQEALVEVAHEALFRSWDRLKNWIEETQDDHILLRQVRTAADWWDKHECKPEYLWLDERLKPVYAMQQRLEPHWEEHEKEFIRLEVERLQEELNNPSTTHRRRSAIGERLDALGDPRPGVGLVQGILPLQAMTGQPPAVDLLCAGEIRLWGDKPEHVGLPDLVWLRVDGGAIQIKSNTYTVEPFYIAKYPVTYKQFETFVDAEDGFKDSRWWKGLSAEENYKSKLGEQNFKFYNHPRENVSWYDSIAFCRWLNERLRWATLPTNLNTKTLDTFTGLRLPTEWEWQWAATGGHKDYKYPWGTEWDESKANTVESGLGRTTAVGMYIAGSAKCGALDLSGNVWEWCLNERNKPENIGLRGNAYRVVRGGSWNNGQGRARASNRGYSNPLDQHDLDLGFRVVVRPTGVQG
jgi:hypothetical protein